MSTQQSILGTWDRTTRKLPSTCKVDVVFGLQVTTITVKNGVEIVDVYDALTYQEAEAYLFGLQAGCVAWKERV